MDLYFTSTSPAEQHFKRREAKGCKQFNKTILPKKKNWGFITMMQNVCSQIQEQSEYQRYYM